MEHVDSWPMEKYPFKGPNGLPVSNYWKSEILRYDGRADFHTWKGLSMDERGEKVMVEKELQPKMAFVTSLPGKLGKGQDYEEVGGQVMTEKMMPQDLRGSEEKIGGKPSRIQMGLWAKYVDGRWIMDDMKKMAMPRIWRDVTEEYYKKWRPEAYAEFDDPYAKDKRPMTRMQELEMEAKEKEEKLKEMENLTIAQNKRIAALEAKNNA